MADLEATFGLDYAAFRKAAGEVRRLGGRTAREVDAEWAKQTRGVKELVKSFTGIGLGASAAFGLMRGGLATIDDYTKAFPEYTQRVELATEGTRAFALSLGRDLAEASLQAQSDLSKVLSTVDSWRSTAVNFVSDSINFLNPMSIFEDWDAAGDVDAARKAEENSIKQMRLLKKATEEKKRQRDIQKELDTEAYRMQIDFLKEVETARGRGNSGADALRTLETRERLELEKQIVEVLQKADWTYKQQSERIQLLKDLSAGRLELAKTQADIEAAKASAGLNATVADEERQARIDRVKLEGHKTEAEFMERQIKLEERLGAVMQLQNVSYEERAAAAERITQAELLTQRAMLRIAIAEKIEDIEGMRRDAPTRVLGAGLGAAAGFVFGPGGGDTVDSPAVKAQRELAALQERQYGVLKAIEKNTSKGGSGGGTAVFGR
jgi:hypothetical protein